MVKTQKSNGFSAILEIKSHQSHFAWLVSTKLIPLQLILLYISNVLYMESISIFFQASKPSNSDFFWVLKCLNQHITRFLRENSISLHFNVYKSVHNF